MRAFGVLAPYNKAMVALLVPAIASLIGTLFGLDAEVTAAIATLLGAIGVAWVPNMTA